MVLMLFAALALVSFSNVSPIHPGALAFITRQTPEALECRDSGGPGSVLDAPKPTRTALQRATGSYDCHRPVFGAGERNPYVDRALQAELPHAQRVAQALVRRLDGVSKPVSVRIDGVPEEALRGHLAALYRSELTTVLGPGRVDHGDAGEPRLVIMVYRVDVPELMSDAYLETKDRNGEVLWRGI